MIRLQPRLRKPPFGTVQVDQSDPIARDLVLCYLFNEPGGTKIYDISGSGRHASYLASTPGIVRTVSAVSGNFAVKNTGAAASDCVLPTVPFSIGPALTIDASIWFGANMTATHPNLLLSDSGITNAFGLADTTTNVLLFTRASAQSNGTIQMTAGKWNHVAVTQDAAGAWTMYVNGQLDTTGAGGTTAIVVDAILGGSAFDRTLLATVDYLRIWNRPLKQREVQNLIQEPYSFLEPYPRIRYWSAAATANTPITGVDSDLVGASDAAALTAAIVALDSVLAGISEARALTVALAQPDSDLVGTTESGSPVAGAYAAADSDLVGATESASPVAGAYAAADSELVGVSEANSLAVALASPDSLLVGAVEVAGVVVGASSADSDLVGVAEAPALTVAVSAADSLLVGITEVATVDVGGVITPIDVADSALVGMAESAALTAALSAADSELVGTAEFGQPAVALAQADSELVGVAESGAPVPGAYAAADSVAAVGADAASLTASAAAADAPAVGAAESPDEAAAIAAADSVGVGVAELASLVVSGGDATVAVQESLPLGLAESAAVDVQTVGTVAPPAPPPITGTGFGSGVVGGARWIDYYLEQQRPRQVEVEPAGEAVSAGLTEGASVERRRVGLRRKAAKVDVVIAALLRDIYEPVGVGLTERAVVEVTYDAVAEAIREEDELVLMGAL